MNSVRCILLIQQLESMLESIVEEASDFVQNWMKTDLMEKVNLWMTQLTCGNDSDGS